MSAIVAIVIALIIVGLLAYLVNTLPIDGRFKAVIQVVVVITLNLWIVDGFGLMSGGPTFHSRGFL